MSITMIVIIAIAAVVISFGVLWASGAFIPIEEEKDMGKLDPDHNVDAKMISVDEWIARYGLAPAREMPATRIRPARGSVPMRITWKDGDGNAQSVVVGLGPAEALIPKLLVEMVTDPPDVTELKVRRS